MQVQNFVEIRSVLSQIAFISRDVKAKCFVFRIQRMTNKVTKKWRKPFYKFRLHRVCEDRVAVASRVENAEGEVATFFRS